MIASPHVAQLIFGGHVHPIYREQLHAVPEGWRYVSAHPGLDEADNAPKLVSRRKSRMAGLGLGAERVAMRALSVSGYVHRIPGKAMPDVELFHACERLLRRPSAPYVVDFEHLSVFVLYQQAALARPWTRKLLERALLDERLRFLLPWTELARRSVLCGLDASVAARLEPKVKVIGPAIRPAVAQPPLRRSGPLRVLFVGTQFIEKGGVDAVLAVREARHSHEITMDMVSAPPREWQDQLEREPGITLHRSGLKFSKLQELFAAADVLLFPSHMDTYGYVVLEAMSRGLPVIGPRWHACDETVLDRQSGLLYMPENMLWLEDGRCRFDHVLPLPKDFLAALSQPSDRLVRDIATQLVAMTDHDARGLLGAGALESVQTGHLSIARRSDALRAVYDLAVLSH